MKNLFLFYTWPCFCSFIKVQNGDYIVLPSHCCDFFFHQKFDKFREILQNVNSSDLPDGLVVFILTYPETSVPMSGDGANVFLTVKCV